MVALTLLLTIGFHHCLRVACEKLFELKTAGHLTTISELLLKSQHRGGQDVLDNVSAALAA